MAFSTRKGHRTERWPQDTFRSCEATPPRATCLFPLWPRPRSRCRASGFCCWSVWLNKDPTSSLGCSGTFDEGWLLTEQQQNAGAGKLSERRNSDAGAAEGRAQHRPPEVASLATERSGSVMGWPQCSAMPRGYCRRHRGTATHPAQHASTE